MHILYLTYDLSDAASIKRVRMLKAGGASVTAMGFRRCETPVIEVAGSLAIDLGQSYNARFLHRIALVLRVLFGIKRHRELFQSADVIVARNLEMLAIAVRGRTLCHPQPGLVYESLDIHRLLLRRDAIGGSLRALEGWLSRRAGLLITSSPAFIREYFEPISRVRLPTLLLENKTFPETPLSHVDSPTRPMGPPWRIGWFGALRCRKSLALLSEVARAHPHTVEIILRGRPSYDQIPDFEAATTALPNLRYLGTYRQPEELASIYHDVHFTWAIDQFEAGMNSEWLLPNRLYEGGSYGSIPLAVEGTEISRHLASLGIGYALEDFSAASLVVFLHSLTAERYQALAEAARNAPIRHWQNDRADCEALVGRLHALSKPHSALLPPTDPAGALLVVIPCLNEATHIGPLLDYFIAESASCPMRIVVADGGSSDGTVEIIQRYASAHPELHYLHNPRRIQSAAINLAVAMFGRDHDYLVRIDAHAAYPEAYCRTLRDEAVTTGADSVVVAMRTRGTLPFQQAVAAAQNSPLGNGGAAHRNVPAQGQWVDHGHHALMRIAAFQAIGGYDESFRHNEDAELDQRLRNAGFRLWLTAATTLDYYPRATPASLFRQYRNYGFGRLQNLRKHRVFPKLRQLLPVAVMPAAALAVLSPLLPITALPFAMWALVCLAYGLLIAWRTRSATLAMSGPAAMVMHSGWSLGFWQGLLTTTRARG